MRKPASRAALHPPEPAVVDVALHFPHQLSHSGEVLPSDGADRMMERVRRERAFEIAGVDPVRFGRAAKTEIRVHGPAAAIPNPLLGEGPVAREDRCDVRRRIVQ